MRERIMGGENGEDEREGGERADKKNLLRKLIRLFHYSALLFLHPHRDIKYSVLLRKIFSTVCY
jgi:hypothetical protein